MSMLQAVWLLADAGSLLLAAPAALAGLVCSCRSGGLGVGRHTPMHGCRVAAANTKAADVAGVTTVEVTITVCEVALLMAFCGLQAARLIVNRKLKDRFPLVLLLNMLATALLLTATASLAANNPDSLLYSGPFALLLPALMAKLAGLTVAIAAEMCQQQQQQQQQPDVADEGAIGREQQPLTPPSTPRRRQQQQHPVTEETLGIEERLLFADEDNLVYEFRADGTLEWRMGSSQGSCINLDSNSRPNRACNKNSTWNC